MTIPYGPWHIVTNHYSYTLNITDVTQGIVTGTIQLTASDTYNISGSWDASTNKLTFTFSFPLNIGMGPFTVTASFTGYLFEGPGSALFQGPPGPASAPYRYLLAGTFQYMGTPYVHGWVARIN